MIFNEWLQTHCVLSQEPGVFASQIVDRFLIDHDGTRDDLIGQLNALGYCPKSLPYAYAGQTILRFL